MKVHSVHTVIADRELKMIFRVREIADHFDFSSLEDANDFVNGKPKDATLNDYVPNNYVVSPATEKELREEIELMETELSRHKDHLERDELDELLLRLEEYRVALGDLQASTITIDTVNMNHAITFLMQAASLMAPTFAEQTAFTDMVKAMRNEKEPPKTIVIQLTGAILDGLRFGNWPTAVKESE